MNKNYTLSQNYINAIAASSPVYFFPNIVSSFCTALSSSSTGVNEVDGEIDEEGYGSVFTPENDISLRYPNVFRTFTTAQVAERGGVSVEFVLQNHESAFVGEPERSYLLLNGMVSTIRGIDGCAKFPPGNVFIINGQELIVRLTESANIPSGLDYNQEVEYNNVLGFLSSGPNSILNDGSIYHVVLTFDYITNTAKMYINSILVDTKQFLIYNGYNVGIPREGYFNGLFGGISIFERILDDAEIEMHYEQFGNDILEVYNFDVYSMEEED